MTTFFPAPSFPSAPVGVFSDGPVFASTFARIAAKLFVPFWLS